MKNKIDSSVLIVSLFLLVGCGCMYIYGQLSIQTFMIVVGIVVAILLIYLYLSNYKDNHYGGKFHEDFPNESSSC